MGWQFVHAYQSLALTMRKADKIVIEFINNLINVTMKNYKKLVGRNG